MDHIKIEQASVDDVIRLQAISRQTFSETFAASNSEENMRQFLDEHYAINKLTDELNNPDAQFYFALANEQVIGYLKLNSGTAQTELKNENGLEIERIYVAKAFLGKKVGQLLFEKAIEIAQRRKSAYLWLGVWEKNHRAIAFYEKNGFVVFGKHIFRLGDDEQTDIMMKLELI
jgi:ribosomal protein S18 acetylase RimI-like enzyme